MSYTMDSYFDKTKRLYDQMGNILRIIKDLKDQSKQIDNEHIINAISTYIEEILQNVKTFKETIQSIYKLCTLDEYNTQHITL